MAITKTDFMRGMQCPKMLWLDKHRPGLKVIPPEIQARLDAGNDFGDRAMGMFGPYEEMTVYRPGTTIPDKAAMLQRTREHLEAGTRVICEAAFCNYNNYCAVDILRKTETGYDFYEVKNAGEVQPQFIKDAAFQYYIISRCKLKIGRIFIVIHGPDEDNPFVPVDVTKEAKGYYKWINDHIWDLNRMQKQPEEIEVQPGTQCSDPYECWYYGYCHGGDMNREQIERIRYYEDLLLRLQQLASRADVTEKEFSGAAELVQELESYYNSTEWKQDYTADEEGLLPKDLKRGVLSEDGIYNVLELYRERVEEFVSENECNGVSESNHFTEE